MVLDVDTPSLRSAASDLSGAADTVASTAGDVGNLGDVSDANVQAGLDALTVAWSAAIDVLADDIRYLGGRTNGAADRYDTTDNGLANGFRGRRIP
jgi:hypothetical protein